MKTAEDFGSQGEPPSHPELLDWLATEFVRDGWNVKSLQRLIVTSATYRQSSKVSVKLLARDPENRLLARGPRFRLPAEMIRDNALRISGLLVPRIGGPSVMPYESPGLWEELAFGGGFSAEQYRQGTGDDLYRRSIYTYWKRTVPPAALNTLDAPDREACVVRRSRTNTPLQALVLLNDPTYIEASRQLAERIMANSSDENQRIEFAFRAAMAREPTAAEIEILRKLFQQRRAAFQQGSTAALAAARRRSVKAKRGIRSGRIGSLDDRGQRDIEPRRNHHSAVTMNPQREYELLMTRRQLFGRTAVGIGVAALGSLANLPLLAATSALHHDRSEVH